MKPEKLQKELLKLKGKEFAKLSLAEVKTKVITRPSDGAQVTIGEILCSGGLIAEDVIAAAIAAIPGLEFYITAILELADDVIKNLEKEYCDNGQCKI